MTPTAEQGATLTRTQASERIRKAHTFVQAVHRVYPPDDAGGTEVLFVGRPYVPRGAPDEPLTAYLSDDEEPLICTGW